MSRDWKQATRGRRCPICKNEKRCASSSDGVVVKCTRVLDGPTVIKTGSDDVGEYAIHKTGSGELPAKYVPTPKSPRADLEVIDTVYRALLECLSLSANHRSALIARDLPEAIISARMFRTMPDAKGRTRRSVIANLCRQFPDMNLCLIPGFYRIDGELRLGGDAGLIVPVCNPEGLITSLRIRRDTAGDDGPRYRVLSSSSHDGPEAVSGFHMPPPHEGLDLTADTIRITEGELKADVATWKTQQLTIGLPGISASRNALDWVMGVHATTPIKVILAPDADKADNEWVCASVCRLAERLDEAGIPWSLEDWDATDGKGIDDVLANPGAGWSTIRSFTGMAAWARILECHQSSGREIPPGLRTRAGIDVDPSTQPETEPTGTTSETLSPLAHLIARTQLDHGAAFTPEALALAAELRATNMPLAVSLRQQLSTIPEFPRKIWEEQVQRADLERARATRGAPSAHQPNPTTGTSGGADEPEHPHHRQCGDYLMRPGEILHRVFTRDGDRLESLANFSALIKAEHVEDDGSGGPERRVYEIEAHLRNQVVRTIRVPSNDFAGLAWVGAMLGSHAIIAPGASTRDRLRAAIQHLSSESSEHHVFTFTGWTRSSSGWIYLHAGGALGGKGDVRLEGPISGYSLPSEPASHADRRAAWDLLNTPDTDIPLYLGALAWRAALGPSPTTVMLAAPPQMGKTTIACLFAAHFGPALAETIVAQMQRITAVSLSILRTIVGDAIVVADDYVVTGNPNEDAKMMAKLDSSVRGQHSGAGATRTGRDGRTLHHERPARSQLLVTGEVPAQGHSLRSRVLVLEFERKLPLDIPTLQERARSGVYARVMASFLEWCAPRLDTIRSTLDSEARLAASGFHGEPRTTAMLGHLYVGLRHFVAFLSSRETVSHKEIATLEARVMNAFSGLSVAHDKAVAEQDPVDRTLQALRSALMSGRCHLTSPSGAEPTQGHAFGWANQSGEQRALGERVGVVDGEEMWIEPGAVLSCLRRAGDTIPLSPRLLAKRLLERGLLLSTEPARETTTVRRTVQGRQVGGFLHLSIASLAFEVRNVPEATEGGNQSEYPA